MKLNKKGWGYAAFFSFILLFIICLIVVAVALRAHGLLDENWSFKSISNKEKTNYTLLENNVVEASKKYVGKYYNNELGLDTLYIKVNQLVSNNFIEEVKDNDGTCSGYVSVYLNDRNNIVYEPYLKCKKYTTKGYNERHDN